MKKLPKIYQAEFNKKITNNKKSCYLEKGDYSNKQDEISIRMTIEEIFSGLGYPYNVPLIITTKEKVYETSLIAKTKQNVITLENQTIPISEIISIKKKNN